jgi:hypothetical protein
MDNIELKTCSICGVSEKDTPKFYYNSSLGENLCNKHYVQLLRRGEVYVGKLKMENECCICNKRTKHMRVYYIEGEYYGKTFCNRHFSQISKLGKIFEKTIKDKNDYEIKDDHVEIILRNQKLEEINRTEIDIDDLEKIIKYKWGLNYGGYAQTGNSKDGARMMSSIILDYNGMIDHIDRNKLNNKRKNLRKADKSLNALNCGLRTNNISGITGVSFCSRLQKWRSKITINKKQIELGYFKDKEDAIYERLKYEKNLLGDTSPQKYLFNNYGL